MKIIIQTPGFTASPSLRSFVKEKVEKLSTLNENILRADVTLVHEAKGKIDKVICQIKLEVRGKDHIAKASSHIFEDSILKSVDILKRKFRKSKTKKLVRRTIAKKSRRVL